MSKAGLPCPPTIAASIRFNQERIPGKPGSHAVQQIQTGTETHQTWNHTGADLHMQKHTTDSTANLNIIRGAELLNYMQIELSSTCLMPSCPDHQPSQHPADSTRNESQANLEAMQSNRFKQVQKPDKPGTTQVQTCICKSIQQIQSPI